MELLIERMLEWMLEDYICRLKFPCTICKYEHQTNSWVFLVSSNLRIQSFYEQISN
jgi:hypothetical protein